MVLVCAGRNYTEGKQMKRLFIVFLMIFVLVGTGVFGATKIFYVNLFDDDVDVRLGDEDDYIFRMIGLEAFSSTYLLETDETGSFKLYFKLNSEDEWYYWVDDDDSPYYCSVERGKSYCILIGWDGRPEYFELNESRSGYPKVCFLNGSRSELTRMEVANEWRDSDIAFANNLSTNTITNFVAIDPGNYSLFWQFPEQEDYDEYYYYPDDSGEYAEVFSFREDNYYLFLAYTVGRTDYAILYNITP